MKNSDVLYMEEINKIPRLTEEEERELFISIANGKDAKDKIIESNLRLVATIARKYIGNGIDFLDIVQEGTFGLMTAVDKFDVSKGWKFGTYASYWVKLYIQRAIYNSGKTIRVPVYILDNLKRVNRYISEYVSKNGEEPSCENISSALNISMDKVKDCLTCYMNKECSLNETLKEDSKTSFEEVTADENVSVEDEVVNKLLIENVKSLLVRLNKNERKVIELHYGLTGGKEKTFSEIGKIMGMSKQCCSWLEGEAFKKLRKELNKKIFEST